MKRGYFFSIDALFAITIIIIGLYLIFASWHQEPDVETAREISYDLMQLLFDIKVTDVCWGNPGVNSGPNTCGCQYISLTNIYCNPATTLLNEDLSLLEFIGELYSRGNIGLPMINDLILETVEKSELVPKNYNYTFLLTDLRTGNVTAVYPI
ncbi:hypothetical protein H6504_02360 [Candidatus Woesearchaeota archaeon]|nr:hypothetical protein [Candidatus Woesearchaeota archaeon]